MGPDVVKLALYNGVADAEGVITPVTGSTVVGIEDTPVPVGPAASDVAVPL